MKKLVPLAIALAMIPAAIALAVLGVKPEYLDASLDEMHKRYGTIENYFDKALGIDANGQQALRKRFLNP